MLPHALATRCGLRGHRRCHRPAWASWGTVLPSSALAKAMCPLGKWSRWPASAGMPAPGTRTTWRLCSWFRARGQACPTPLQNRSLAARRLPSMPRASNDIVWGRAGSVIRLRGRRTLRGAPTASAPTDSPPLSTRDSRAQPRLLALPPALASLGISWRVDARRMSAARRRTYAPVRGPNPKDRTTV